MGKTDNRRASETSAVERRSPPSDPDADVLGGGNLEQVREILFGAQSRVLDKRLARIEEELPKRVAEIRDELKRSLAALEAYVRQEIDAVNERLRLETQERGQANDALGGKLDEAVKTLHKEAGQVDGRAAAAQRELRQLLLDHGKRIDEDLQRRSDELAAALTRAVEELRHEKADRRAVAGILHEVAMRLNDELALPLGGEAEP